MYQSEFCYKLLVCFVTDTKAVCYKYVCVFVTEAFFCDKNDVVLLRKRLFVKYLDVTCFFFICAFFLSTFASSDESDTRTSSRNIYIGCVKLVSEGS